MVIKYKKRRSYGQDRFYIQDSKIQKGYEELTGKSTLTPSTIKALESLGFVLEEIN